jgi:cytochrome c553
MIQWLNVRRLLRFLVLGACVTLAGTGWAQPDEARAKKIVSGVCFVCHGAEGESSSELFPRLAGQHWEYTAKQLANFKAGKRKSTAMADMVAKLTPDEMVSLGRYFEKMAVVKEPAKEPDLAAVGKYIYHQGNKFSGVPACAGCHGPRPWEPPACRGSPASTRSIPRPSSSSSTPGSGTTTMRSCTRL